MDLDLKSNVDVAQSLAPEARTTTGTGTGVPLANYAGAMVVIGAGLWTDGTHTFSIEESDDDSDYTEVVAGDLDGTPPAIDGDTLDNQIYRIGYRGIKPFIRAVQTVTGSPATGLVASASVVRAGKRKRPV